MRSLTGTAASCVMLQAMQPATSTHSSPGASDFAGLLATLATPPSNAAEDESLWSSSDLGGDVASLSYERALRAHARYRPADPIAHRDDASLLPLADSGTGVASPVPSAAAPQRDLRTASVTIRLSRAESAQLHRRAAEAGLTVSAYLRSCALEAEELRAQVKLALAELKTGNAGATKQATGNREQGSEDPGPVDRGSKQAGRRAGEGMRTTRALARLGRFWMRLSTRGSC
ncbi:MAG: plasmid mobilization protein [Terracidiphilus sp.]